MPRTQREVDQTGRYPFTGIPSGWYVIALSRELAAGQVVGRQCFGRECVLYRTESGRAVLIDAHCPHMGAHLEDGKVAGESLVCPFHGFQFDTEGSCVGTPYGQGLPPRAQTHPWILREQSGLVLAWYDADDKPPEWSVPALDLDGWSPLIHREYEIESHPQETTENSIDFGHFTSVHNFPRAEMGRDVTTDGPKLCSGYSIDATLGVIGLPNRSVHVDFDVEVWGLGYSLVNLTLEAFGVQGRLFVLPTPIDEENITLRLACMTNHRWKPMGRLLRAIIARQFWAEVEEDIPIWRRKKYVDPPALAPGDGPVTLYRRWAEQFYPTR